MPRTKKLNNEAPKQNELAQEKIYEIINDEFVEKTKITTEPQKNSKTQTKAQQSKPKNNRIKKPEISAETRTEVISQNITADKKVNPQHSNVINTKVKDEPEKKTKRIAKLDNAIDDAKKTGNSKIQKTIEPLIAELVELKKTNNENSLEQVIEPKKLSRGQARRKKKSEKKKKLLESQASEKQQLNSDKKPVKNIPQEKPKKSEAPHKPKIEIIPPYKVPTSKELNPRQKKIPIVNRFLNTIESFLKNRLFVETEYKIVLGVSGGVDSVVMMDCMALLSEKIGFKLYIAHFNHNLRGKESDKDVDFVKNLCEQYNLQFITSSGNVKVYSQKNNLSIENAARVLRYNFFERTTRNLEADLLATAHTSDDSVETFFINLMRGSGLTGLCGIPESRKFVKNVKIIRPLLSFSKDEIKKYAEARKLSWREDETNILQNYTRNKVRLDLLPKLRAEYNPMIDEAVLRTAKLIFGADAVIHEMVKKYLYSIVTEVNSDRISIKVPILMTHSDFIQGEIVQTALMKYFKMQAPSLNTVDRILSLCEKQTGAQIEIGGGYIALKDRNLIIIARNTVFKRVKLFGTIPTEFRINGFKLTFTKVDKKSVKITENPNVEYFDFEKLGTYVEIRNWEQGDTFHPLGAPGEMKVSDFLTNEKVSMLDKPNILLLRNTFETVWVIGKRISENFKIDGDTRSIIKAEIINL